MKNLHSVWDNYEQLQAKSRKIGRIDSYSWGVEAELDAFLVNTAMRSPTAEQIVEKARNTAARRERSHKTHLEKYASDARPQAVNAVAMLEARQVLTAMSHRIPTTQWNVLLWRAQGHSYDSIAKAIGISPGACRVQAIRSRKSLHDWKCAA